MLYLLFSDGSPAPLRVSEIGFARDCRVTRFGPGRRATYIVHYVLDGRGFYNSRPVFAGQGFLIRPGQLTDYAPDEADPWSFLWIQSADDGMGEIFERYDADPNSLIFEYGREQADSFRRVSEYVIQNTDAILDSLKILEIYLHLLNLGGQKETVLPIRPNADVYLEHAVNYIEANIDQPVSVGDLTRLLGISQAYLYRIFSDQFRMSPKQYILLRKIGQAKQMLAETDMSVTQIAHSVGYADVLAFSRLFARKEGHSPRQFRNESRER